MKSDLFKTSDYWMLEYIDNDYEIYASVDSAALTLTIAISGQPPIEIPHAALRSLSEALAEAADRVEEHRS